MIMHHRPGRNTFGLTVLKGGLILCMVKSPKIEPVYPPQGPLGGDSCRDITWVRLLGRDVYVLEQALKTSLGSVHRAE